MESAKNGDAAFHSLLSFTVAHRKNYSLQISPPPRKGRKERRENDSNGGSGPRSNVFMPTDDSGGGGTPYLNLYRPTDDSAGGGSPVLGVAAVAYDDGLGLGLGGPGASIYAAVAAVSARAGR